jgi:cytidylate kinase
MTSPEHLTEALARANQHWLQRHGDKAASEERAPAAFAIAFSRETGTYGAAIAREVGNRLGWPVYDRELLQRIADDLGVHRTLLESVDEKQRDWLSECVWGFFATPDVNETVYFRRLVETLLSLAVHGNCVIVGRGATNIMPRDTTLRVRVVAPLEHRIESVQREHKISVQDATARVENTDQERNRFIRSHFQIDASDAANYDLVVNAACFSTVECADIVIAALERLRSHPISTVTPRALHAAAPV